MMPGFPWQLGREMQHAHLIHSRLPQHPNLLVEGGEQARHIVSMEHLARMAVEGDEHRLHAQPCGLPAQLVRQVTVTQVYPIKKTYGSSVLVHIPVS